MVTANTLYEAKVHQLQHYVDNGGVALGPLDYPSRNVRSAPPITWATAYPCICLTRSCDARLGSTSSIWDQSICWADARFGRGSPYTILEVPALLSLRGFRRRVLKQVSDRPDHQPGPDERAPVWCRRDSARSRQASEM
jgi:hypothetical protein